MTAAAGRYYRAMFPSDVELRGESDGYSLVFNGRTIALATDLDRGGCRMCRHPGLAAHMGYGYAPSRAEAVRYLERWVARWEPELRAIYSQPLPTGYFSE